MKRRRERVSTRRLGLYGAIQWRRCDHVQNNMHACMQQLHFGRCLGTAKTTT